MDITPVIPFSTALQDIAEALRKLTDQLPTPDRPPFEASLKRVSRARVELLVWCQEHR
jgi:hypothetical protein